MKRLMRAVLLALLLGGCQPDVGFLQAYYLYRQGDFQQSLLQYFRLRQRPEYAAWADYNIGTVYLALGESAAALEWWQQLPPPPDPQLALALAYNRGVAAHNAGQLQQAREYFIDALQLDPDHYPSKVNLEVTLRHLQRNVNRSPSPPVADELPQLDAQRLLDFVNREERWFRWAAEPGLNRREDW